MNALKPRLRPLIMVFMLSNGSFAWCGLRTVSAPVLSETQPETGHHRAAGLSQATSDVMVYITADRTTAVYGDKL